MQSRLEVNLYREGEQRLIIADVKDEGESFKFTFGRNQSIKHIWSQIPKLVMDARFEAMIRERVAM
jgi:hypothetical protein